MLDAREVVTLPLSLTSPIAESVSSASMASCWPCSRTVPIPVSVSVSTLVPGTMAVPVGWLLAPAGSVIPTIIHSGGWSFVGNEFRKALLVLYQQHGCEHDGRDVAQEELRVVLDRVCLVRRSTAGPHRQTALVFSASCPLPCHTVAPPAPIFKMGRAFLQQSSPVLSIPMKSAPIARAPHPPPALLSFPQNVVIFSSRRCTKRHTCI